MKKVLQRSILLAGLFVIPNSGFAEIMGIESSELASLYSDSYENKLDPQSEIKNRIVENLNLYCNKFRNSPSVIVQSIRKRKEFRDVTLGTRTYMVTERTAYYMERTPELGDLEISPEEYESNTRRDRHHPNYNPWYKSKTEVVPHILITDFRCVGSKKSEISALPGNSFLDQFSDGYYPRY